MLKDCPDSYENINTSAYFSGQYEDDVYLSNEEHSEMLIFTTEANNCAVLDSACSSTVCG